MVEDLAPDFEKAWRVCLSLFFCAEDLVEYKTTRNLRAIEYVKRAHSLLDRLIMSEY